MDAWIAEQPDRPVRPEAIRCLVSAALELTRPKRSAAPKEPDFEPSLEQIEAIDRYRAGIEMSRVDAISLLGLSMSDCGASEPATWIDRGRGRRSQARRLIAERYRHGIKTLLT